MKNLDTIITVQFLKTTVFSTGTVFTHLQILTLISKVLHHLAPEPLAEFLSQRKSCERDTRGSVGGDCFIPLRRSTFSKSAWSVRSACEWNSVPEEVKLLTTCKALTQKCGLSTTISANTDIQACCNVLIL